MPEDREQIDLPLPGPADPAVNDPDLPGPFTVGRWAKEFQGFLKQRPRILLLGEVFNLKRARASTYFELRDSDGAAPCSIWNSDLDKLKLSDGALKDGAEVVLGGGPDYYAGSATASPSFSFRATYVRLAGEGDLLAQLDRSRRQLEAEGLLRPQKDLPRPAVPKTIGVVTARNSAACADLLAGLERRGWRGTIVWADAPVQDRRAAGAVGAALRGLAEQPRVEVAVVCRGGGSLTDLWAFCDENLCRTIAMLRLPVISAVGHESDRTLIDDVAAVSCSTPTHAAEALVQLDITRARAELGSLTATGARASSIAIRNRAQRLIEFSGAPTRSLRLERGRLHQMLREVRASATRGAGERRRLAERHSLVITRKGDAFGAADSAARAQLTANARAIRARGRTQLADAINRVSGFARTAEAHDPQRTLERGYALVTDPTGEQPIDTAAAAHEQERVSIRFADDAVAAKVERDGSDQHTA